MAYPGCNSQVGQKAHCYSRAVPEVYGYDACPNNEVRGAYILQERVCDWEQLFSETNLKLSLVASGSKT